MSCLRSNIQTNHRHDIRLPKNLSERVDRLLPEYISICELECGFLEQQKCAFNIEILAGKAIFNLTRFARWNYFVRQGLAG